MCINNFNQLHKWVKLIPLSATSHAVNQWDAEETSGSSWGRGNPVSVG